LAFSDKNNLLILTINLPVFWWNFLMEVDALLRAGILSISEIST
jgi:hypothetical protein